jgi:RHS repeat-associated protein
MSKNEYDWVAAPPSGSAPCTVSDTIPVLRKTENRFWNPPGGATSPTRAGVAPTIGLINAYWNTTAYRKRDSLLETRIYAADETDATKAKVLTQFEYDDPNSTGNVTRELRWDNQLASASTPPAAATSAATLTTSTAAVTTMTYYAGGLLASLIDPSGNLTQYAYGQIQTRSDGTGSTCPATFNGIGPTSKTSPEGQTWNYYYDCATGVLNDEVFQTNQNLLTKYDHDTYGRVKSETTGPSNDRVTTTTYDDGYRQVYVVQDGKLGRVSHYNQLGQLYLDRENPDAASSPITAASTVDIRSVTMEAAPGDGTSSPPDAAYSLTSNPFLSNGASTEPTLGWTLQKFDQAGRVSDVSYFSGQAKPAPFGTNASLTAHETYVYTGNTTTITDPQTNTRATTTDALGRVISASEGSFSTATYTYDVLDNLTSVTQTDSTNYGGSKTQTRTFIYSSLGRLVWATNPEADVATTYTYYPNGSQHTRTDARGVTTTFTVDGLNRVKTKDYSATTPVTPAVRYCYDGKKYDLASDACVTDGGRAADYARGALTDAVAWSVVNGVRTMVSETQYTNIDALGRALASTQTTAGLAPGQFTYQYVAGGALSAVKYPSGRWVTYDINGANRVSVVRNGQSGSNYYLNGAQYKANGSMASATLGTATASWDYNSRLQARKVGVTKGTQTLLGLQWVYSSSYDSNYLETGTDNNGNVKFERLQFPSAGTMQDILRSYTYDGANRLSTYAEPGKSEGYGYDAFGNLWQTTGASDLRPTGASWYLLPDNSVRNRLTNTAYDAAGNQTQLSISAGGTNATYDAEDRLVKVDVGGTTLVAYDYDADGRRVKRTDANGVATWYVYDAKGQLMAEYGGTGTTAGTPQYLIADQVGSTRLVLDGAGNCTVRMDYAPFGAVVPRTGLDCYGTPWTSGKMFTGQLRDGDTTAGTSTGLDYMGARQYWASLGRFTSPDPENAGADPSSPGSWNGYSYAYNNPLMYTDPTGLDVEQVGNCFFNVTRDTETGNITGASFGGCVDVLDRMTQTAAKAWNYLKNPNNFQYASCVAGKMGTWGAAATAAGAGTGLLLSAPTGELAAPAVVPVTAVIGGGGGAIAGGISGLITCSSGTGNGPTSSDSGGDGGASRLTAGSKIRKVVNTPSGRYEIEATVDSIQGKKVVLKLVNVFPEGGGTGTPGVSALLNGLREALGDLKAAGFSEVQINQTLRLNGPRLINGFVIHL